jgi:hypothetical protein
MELNIASGEVLHIPIYNVKSVGVTNIKYLAKIH